MLLVGGAVTVIVEVTVFVTVRTCVTVCVGPVTVWNDVEPGPFTVFFLVTVTLCLTVFGFAETATMRVVPFLVIVWSEVAAFELESDPIATPIAAPRTISSDPPAIVANALEPKINRTVSMPALESTLPAHGTSETLG
jgi:hypothetical protein